MVKRKIIILISIMVMLLLLVSAYPYFFMKKNYYFDMRYIKHSKIMDGSKEMKKGVTDLGLKHTIVANYRQTLHLKLSKYQLHKIVTSKKTKRYAKSYKTDDNLVSISPID